MDTDRNLKMSFTNIGQCTNISPVALALDGLFSFGKNKKKVKEKETSEDRNDVFDRVLKEIASLNLRYPKAILGIFILLTVVSIFGYTLIEVETNSIEFMSKDLPVRQAYDYVDSHMGGFMSMEIMLNTGKENGIKDIEFLRQMETLQNRIDKHPLTWKTTSVIDILSSLEVNMGKPSRLPSQLSAVPSCLLL
ncbi:MAG: hypothetical protein DRP27_05050 [Thermotogae bacterium]|nr:MAG: hypothetical protein DRP27_05050 [Thermotogota bacterium]RLG33754.1 MAG: hypothetical protein DRN97_04235 [Methanosarcinales archaeon]